MPLLAELPADERTTATLLGTLWLAALAVAAYALGRALVLAALRRPDRTPWVALIFCPAVSVMLVAMILGNNRANPDYSPAAEYARAALPAALALLTLPIRRCRRKA